MSAPPNHISCKVLLSLSSLCNTLDKYFVFLFLVQAFKKILFLFFF